MEIEKILTENPYVDELVYYCKILGSKTVLKNPTFASENETLEAAKASTLYIACMKGTAMFEQFTFSRQMFEMSTVDKNKIDTYLIDPNKVPKDKRKELIDIASKIVIDNYVEYNNYYRMLNGLPDINKEGIKVAGWRVPNDVVMDLNKYIHEMTDSEIAVLESYGILDKIKKDHPDATYLEYLGARKINVFDARTADDFEVLYLPPVESIEVRDRFKDRLELNRVYTIKTIYSEAYKYGSYYYDAFICVLIIIQTMLDIISSVQEFIARKEVFDLRSIQYIFKSFGVPFYPEIPTRYQIAMMKNLHTLLKYKSTTKNMVDICSLFGFDNVEIFKYYLLRDRVKDSNGEYIFEQRPIQDPNYPDDPEKVVWVDDYDANYDLKFIKVPLEENANGYLRDPSNHIDYDEIALGDPTWDGEKLHEQVKSEIINNEFSYVRTKYISIDTVYEISKLAFQLPYFFNMLFDDVPLEEQLTVLVPSISYSTRLRLTDTFCYLFALNYLYNGIEDDILDTTGKVLYVKGFNFKADLAALGEWVQEQGYTMEELGVSDFRIPSTSIISYNQLMEIFVRNGKVRDHLIQGMIDADNKRIYDIYATLYDALMVTDFTNDYFRDPNTGEMPRTYTEYLQRREPVLYLSLMSIKSITDKDTQMQKITKIVDNVIYALDEYIDSDEFKYIFSIFPSVNAEHVKQYIVKVITFFKSYKVDLLGINTIYKFDDKLDNFVKIIDDFFIRYYFERRDFYTMGEKLYWHADMTKKEKFAILEKIYFDISTWAELRFKDNLSDYNIKDVLVSLITKKELYDAYELKDDIQLVSLLAEYMHYAAVDHIVSNNGNFTTEDQFDIVEKVFMDITIELDKMYKDRIGILKDEIMITILRTLPADLYIIKDDFRIHNTQGFNDRVQIKDSLFRTEMKTREDSYVMTDSKSHNSVHDSSDIYNLMETIYNTVSLSVSTRVDIRDEIHFDRFLRPKDTAEIIDKIYTQISLTKEDLSNIIDALNLISTEYMDSMMNYSDTLEKIIRLSKRDDGLVIVDEKMVSNFLYKQDKIPMRDTIYINIED